MQERPDHIASLIATFLRGELSESERAELEQVLETSPGYKTLLEQVTTGEGLREGLQQILTIDTTAARTKAVERIYGAQSVQPVHRVHFLNRTWWRYAAAAVIILGLGAYLWKTTQKEKPEVAKTDTPVPLKNDVAPGGNKAVLTLSDGSTIVLDSAARGALATQPGATISKTADGQVVYRPVQQSFAQPVVYNTLSTPRGGQYQLSLPDGSRVWLNAESSITYPVAFTEKTREVAIRGEAYFEVARNAQKPFIVKTRTDVIQVLGTHFNIRAYEEDGDVKTSLAEGSVKIGSHVLKPGQAFTSNKIIAADIEQDIAWKNGIFYFSRTPMNDALRQLSRWYDVEVIYLNGPPSLAVSGKMQRSLDLSAALDIVKRLGVRYTIENRKLIIQ